MSKIKYGIDSMHFMSVFESMTHARLRDCIVSDSYVTFIVEEGEVSKAVGKGGANVKRLERAFKKRIKIVEYTEDLARFIENLCFPAKIKEIDISDGIVKITATDSHSRGLLIGREATILRANETIAKRYFDIEEIKVA